MKIIEAHISFFHEKLKAKITNYVPKKTNKTLVYLFIGLFIYVLLFLIAARCTQAENGGLLMSTKPECENLLYIY